ncbi:MAG: tetratricopeptide repeat protein, partial [Hyphomicrobiaceae bacterium]
NNRAVALMRAGYPDYAIEDYTHAIKLAPSRSEALSGRAHVKLSQNRPHAAMRDLNRALANDGRFALAYRLRGQVHMKLYDYDNAVQDFNRAIAFDPASAGNYLSRGRLRLELRKLHDATWDFSKAIELNPRSFVAHLERGNAYVQTDNLERAERDLGQALTLNPQSGAAFAYRAVMYKKRGEPELGAQEIAKATKLAPTDARVLWAKGEIEEALSQTELAAESYRTALALNPSEKRATKGLERLGQAATKISSVLTDLGKGGWRVIFDGEHYYAVHDRLRGLKVPLEMASEGQPIIVGWEEKTGQFREVGLLTFAAGKTETRTGAAELEYRALVNTRRRAVVDLVLQRRGKDVSKWTWGQGRVTIDGIDGLKTQHVLRKERPALIGAKQQRIQRGNKSRVARQQRNRGGTRLARRQSGAANKRRSRPPRKRRSASRKQAAPKPQTLFSLFAGN